jgi:hypothetical protein
MVVLLFVDEGLRRRCEMGMFARKKLGKDRDEVPKEATSMVNLAE